MKKYLFLALFFQQANALEPLLNFLPKPQIQTTPKPEKKISPVYIGGYGGYGTLNGSYLHDGEYAQYRFCLGVDVLHKDIWTFGFESGVQSGNSMPVDMKSTYIVQAGGLQPQAILKPFLDLLVIVRWHIANKWDILLKGGVAYRQMQLTDRTSSQDALRKFNGEFQGGLSYRLTRHTHLVGLYQGIYSASKVGCTLDAQNEVHMHYIPTQQAGLFGIEYHF